ncbi:MAG: hypothetical protein COA90_08290 [Gammaproteobacteria bacterium]|nr:MAG: hypothetical protein COA90_08290 [Gammaproteobacteria bacterium]
MTSTQEQDNTAVIAQAFFIGNLLFVGVLYIALWGLYTLRYSTSSAFSQQHLRQSLMSSSLSTLIFMGINLFIILTDGYASLTGLVCLEVYFMFIVPLFLAVGLMGFIKAIQGKEFIYPFIGKRIS